LVKIERKEFQRLPLIGKFFTQKLLKSISNKCSFRSFGVSEIINIQKEVVCAGFAGKANVWWHNPAQIGIYGKKIIKFKIEKIISARGCCSVPIRHTANPSQTALFNPKNRRP